MVIIFTYLLIYSVVYFPHLFLLFITYILNTSSSLTLLTIHISILSTIHSFIHLPLLLSPFSVSFFLFFPSFFSSFFLCFFPFLSLLPLISFQLLTPLLGIYSAFFKKMTVGDKVHVISSGDRVRLGLTTGAGKNVKK